MTTKRSLSQRRNDDAKRQKTEDTESCLYKTLQESGLCLKYPPDKCIISNRPVQIVQNIKKNLQKFFNYPRNVSELFSNLTKECEDIEIFKHFLFPNIVRIDNESPEEQPVNESVIKLLLNVSILQDKLIDLIIEKAIDLATRSECGPWIQMILKCFSGLNSIVSTEKISSQLIDLLEITTEKMVRLEIISAIPDIIGDQEHSNVSNELSRIISEDHDLIPAILDCVSYLCLSDEEYEQLQKKTLNILMTLPKCNYFPNFVKFLLMPGRMSDEAYLEAVQGLRNSLGWPTSMAMPQEIATSQVLTATAIRNSMVSSKTIANAWLKTISSCRETVDHKPIDFVLLLILSSTSEEKQKQVENLIKKQIKLNVLKDDLIIKTFEKFKPMLKEYLKTLIHITNSLLQNKSDPLVEHFASHVYTLMFSELEDCSQTVVAELLRLGDRKHCRMNILQTFNNVMDKDMLLLKPQSLQLLILLDNMDDMSVEEIRAAMNLLCGLAYSYENSIIRDDIHMIIRKELGSPDPVIKIRGIFAGVHAVKYLMTMTSNAEATIDFPDDVNYSSVSYLSGDLLEAAQIIELISRSIRQFPDMIAFFYDELSNIVSTASNINKNFLTWLTDAVTNDIQQNFIVSCIETDRIGELKLSMQYCLNEENEMDEMIAINIAGLALKPKDEENIAILSPLFQLVQTLHCKQHNDNLSSIDALLGCPVVMPKFDIELVEDMDFSSVKNILDCLVHCVNWFRELINAFAIHYDDALKCKILKRLSQTDELEGMIGLILIRTKISYKPPICTFNIGKYAGDKAGLKFVKIQSSKQSAPKNTVQQDDTVLPDTVKSQHIQGTLKPKIELLSNMPFRQYNLDMLHLITFDLSTENEDANNLSIKSLRFILRNANVNLENVLPSKLKKNTFLTKQSPQLYDPKKAELCAKSVSEIHPKLMDHLKTVTTSIESYITNSSQNEHDFMYTSALLEHISCLEEIYNFCSVYFRWIGFRSHHNALLKYSLRTVASIENVNSTSLKEIILAVAKLLQKHEKYCLQISTALALVDFLKAIQEFSDNNSFIMKILRDMAKKFLSQQWKSPDGALEKGLVYNQSIDKLASIYFLNSEILALKTLALQLTSEITVLKNRNDTLESFKCINKSNFPILYRNLGTSLYNATKNHLSKGLTNSEHLNLWNDVATVLKYMSDITKTLENRNNLSAFFKKSFPVLKLFVSQGIPIIDIQFKSQSQEVLEILKLLQQSTRFLQSLCCHSVLKKDNVLMSKVPLMRQLLETLIYKVKAALVSNNCSEAFWMGNLKSKNIHGEVIATQQSVESEETVEDCDDQLPDDNDSDETDDELNPDSKSVSDMI